MPVLRCTTFKVPGLPESAGLARRMLDAIVRTWGSPVDAFAAALLLSELVTNAVVHGECPSPGEGYAQIGVLVAETACGLHIEVHDADQGGGREPAIRHTEPERMVESGRGLELVDALAATWGTKRIDGTKYVYFDVEAPDGSGAGGHDGQVVETQRPVSGVSTATCALRRSRATINAQIGALV